MAALAAFTGTAAATADVTSQRLAGDNRYATAQVVATQTFTRATAPIIATGEKFPDALAASYLAGGLRGPILLTPTDSLAPEVVAALTTLQSPSVVIAGGTAAVSTAVENALRSRGLVVDRAGGANRYATARALAEGKPGVTIGSFPGRGRTAILASGDSFPDALAAGPLAYGRSFPVLLTPKDALAPETTGALSSLAIRHVLLVGGAEVVSESVVSQVGALGISVRRIAGDNRSATAAAIADVAVQELGFSPAHVNVARGDSFADALASGPHGAEEQAPLLLAANPDSLHPETEAWLARNAATVRRIDVFGGPTALSDAVVAAARRAAGGT